MNNTQLTPVEQQRAEISTIKERKVSLNLSAADVERLAVKAAGEGLTISSLLENFIGDLVRGTYSNGSDERMYAEQWFERCGFGYCSRKSLLRYYSSQDVLDTVIGQWADLQEAKESLSDPELDSEEREAYEEDVQYFSEAVENFYREYVAWAGKDAKPLEEEMAEAAQWRDSVQSLLRG